MLTYRSRNTTSNFNSIDMNKSFNLNTSRVNEKRHSKNKILTNLTERAGEARIIIHNNNSLKQIISLLKKNNLYTKNFVNKIITINKDIKLHLNNDNSNNIHLYKDNLFLFIKEYNDFIRKNNNILKEKIQKNKEKNENYKNSLEKEINDLNKNLDDSLKINFMLENRNKYKDNVIKDLSQCYLTMGCIQEINKYLFANDDISQSYIDNYYSKQLLVFQHNLLTTTQNWNKFKNRAIRFEQEIEDLEKILENPKKLKEKDIDDKDEQSIINEDDLFLLTFDEFEDESKEIILETEGLTINEDTNNINNNNNNENDNIIKINNNINVNKINTNYKFNKINNVKNQSVNNRRINKLNFIKRDIYYIPQKDFSKSLIKNSESVKKIISKDLRNICRPLPKNNRNVSINSISKLNLKQIVFNKENKFIKEEAKEIARKRFKIESEFKIDSQKNGANNPNDIKLQMQIKELKKDIKTFKEKKMKKKKIIKEFKNYCKDIINKYNIYISNNNNDKCNYTKIKSIKKII